jgi:hypothetical protein
MLMVMDTPSWLLVILFTFVVFAGIGFYGAKFIFS